jgi:hypothetical protein
MLDEHLLDCERAVHLGAIAGRSKVDDARRSGTNVNADRYVELRGQRPVRFHARITRQDARVLVRHLTKHVEFPSGVHRAKLRG